MVLLFRKQDKFLIQCRSRRKKVSSLHFKNLCYTRGGICVDAIDVQKVICLVASIHIRGEFSWVYGVTVSCIHERTRLCLKPTNLAVRFENSFERSKDYFRGIVSDKHCTRGIGQSIQTAINISNRDMNTTQAGRKVIQSLQFFFCWCCAHDYLEEPFFHGYSGKIWTIKSGGVRCKRVFTNWRARRLAMI